MPIHLEFLKKCIDSIRKYTHYPHLTIIIDNGSDNKTKEYIESLFTHPIKNPIRLTVKINEKNLGVAKAINQGIRISQGDIFITQTDVEFTEDEWLKRIVNMAYKNKKIGSVGDIISASGHDGFVGTWAWFIKREVIDKIGLFDESFGLAFSEDTDYYRRILYAGYEIKQIPDIFKHTASQTIGNMEFGDLQKRNTDYLNKKWEGIEWWNPE